MPMKPQMGHAVHDARAERGSCGSVHDRRGRNSLAGPGGCPGPDGSLRITLPDGTIVDRQGDEISHIDSRDLADRLGDDFPGQPVFGSAGWTNADPWGCSEGKGGIAIRSAVRLSFEGEEPGIRQVFRVRDGTDLLEHVYLNEGGGWLCTLREDPERAPSHESRGDFLLFSPPRRDGQVRLLRLPAEPGEPTSPVRRFTGNRLAVWFSPGDRELPGPGIV